METNQNKSSQPQGRSNSNTSNSQTNSNTSQSNFSSSSSNQKSSSSLGGLNMENLSQQWQKYSGPIMNKVNGLSTTQKVVGGTLLAAGAGWLAMNAKNRNKITNTFKGSSKKR